MFTRVQQNRVNAVQWWHSTRHVDLALSRLPFRRMCVSYGVKKHNLCISLVRLLFIHTVRALVISQATLRKMYAGTRFSLLLYEEYVAAFRPSSCPLLNPSPLFAMRSVRQRLGYCLFVPSLYTRLN